MARINVEDSLWSDPRFLKLCIKLGDERTAVGAVLLAWKIAQKFWCPDKELIPIEEWVRSGIGREMIDVGLAEETDLGIYIAGCEKHFEWWFAKQSTASTAGKASAAARKKRFGTAIPKSASNNQIKKRDLPSEHHVRNQPNMAEHNVRDFSSNKQITNYVLSSERDVRIPPNITEHDVRTNPNETERSSSSSSSSSSSFSVDLNNKKDLNINSFHGSVELNAFNSPQTERSDNFIGLSDEARERIRKIYPDEEFVGREIEKMKIWLSANSKKQPKSKAGWTRFVMGWLERGWERYRKGIPTIKMNSFDSDEYWEKVFTQNHTSEELDGREDIQNTACETGVGLRGTKLSSREG